MFLHEHPKFKDLVETLAFERKIPLAIVEKDYWVMHALWGLRENGFTYYFKGGTSLSKGFDIIKRFSEDIDLQIDPPRDLKVYTGKNHQQTKHRASRQEFFNWIMENLSITGLNVETHATTDSKYRNYAVQLDYNSIFPRDEIIKRHVLLEIGFARVSPNETKEISSWCYERASQAGLAVNDNRAKDVPLYQPEYTLIEKLDAINGKYRSGKHPREWVRHYYDVHMLLKLPRVATFVGSDAYKDYMRERFQDEVGRIAELPAYRLEDTERFAALKQAHEAEKGLYFEPQPSFDKIAAHLREWSPKLQFED
jgi:hypothetical protein